jgi:hypothetical protein
VPKAGIRVSGGNGPGEEVTLECMNRNQVFSTNGENHMKLKCGSRGVWNDTTNQIDCVDQTTTPPPPTTTTTTVISGKLLRRQS